MPKMKSFAFFCILGGLQGVTLAQNLLVNGDFEAGNTGFSSDYVYAPGGNSTEGQYTVRNNPGGWNGAFFNIPDHTSGTGLYMVVNGATTGNLAVWRQSVSVVANQQYTFGAWVSSAVGGGPANLILRVDGQEVGSSFVAPQNTGSWVNWTQVLTATSTGNSTIEIVNTSLSAFPNDFYIDDVSLEAVPEPATLVALGLGAVAMLRRRSR